MVEQFIIAALIALVIALAYLAIDYLRRRKR
jgi:hypothetical protein